jgi:hypothetical protein
MKRWMAPLLMLAVAIGTCAQSADLPLAHADSVPTRDGAILGIVPVRGRASPAAPTAAGFSKGTGNLLYHGGPVQTGTHRAYAIYWGSSFSGTYASLINGYFQNVAADSGTFNNVYAGDTQYYQTINGSTTYIAYSEQFGGSWTDPNLPTTNGCTSTAGGPRCVSDAQMQAEVTRAINANCRGAVQSGHQRRPLRTAAGVQQCRCKLHPAQLSRARLGLRLGQ